MDDVAKEPRVTDAEPPEDGAFGRQDSHPPDAVDTLRKAMRRARYDNAERTGVVAEFRAACLGRLELLQEALKPLLAQIPKDVDLFDVGLMPSASPRLFIDMIGFIEMGRDARLYRFVQDTRYGRITLAESGDVETIVDAVTRYVAQRLLERDKALAAGRGDWMDPPSASQTHGVMARDNSFAGPPAESRRPPTRRRASAPFRWTAIGFAFLIDLLGSVAFFLILAGIGWVVWNRLHGQIS